VPAQSGHGRSTGRAVSGSSLQLSNLFIDVTSGHRNHTLTLVSQKILFNMASLTQIEVLLPEFRAYSRSISKSQDEAEDLVQDAIERALRTDKCPNKLEELRPWMFRVIRNLSIDELRKKRVRREYIQAQERLSDGLSSHPDVARDTLLRIAFDKLPPNAREILFLVDIMGTKYSEAAKIIGVQNGTVMSRVSRARRQLLELVDGSEITEARRKKN
jgi:RNA polymerase sigma factor (sigma-70 family)